MNKNVKVISFANAMRKQAESFIKVIEKLEKEKEQYLELYVSQLEKKVSDLTKGIATPENSVVSTLKLNAGATEVKSYDELRHNYHEALKNNKPTLIKRYIKQIFVLFPERFEQFQQEHKMPKNFDKLMFKIEKELKVNKLRKSYMKKTPIVIVEKKRKINTKITKAAAQTKKAVIEKKSKKTAKPVKMAKRVEKPIINVSTKSSVPVIKGVKITKKPRVDYANIEIDKLVKMVQGYRTNNKLQYIKRCLYGLKKVERTKRDVNKFVKNLNLTENSRVIGLL
jgi:hypothetical protein